MKDQKRWMHLYHHLIICSPIINGVEAVADVVHGINDTVSTLSFQPHTAHFLPVVDVLHPSAPRARLSGQVPDVAPFQEIKYAIGNTLITGDMDAHGRVALHFNPQRTEVFTRYGTHVDPLRA